MCVPLSVKLVCARGIINVATLQCALCICEDVTLYKVPQHFKLINLVFCLEQGRTGKVLPSRIWWAVIQFGMKGLFC